MQEILDTEDDYRKAIKRFLVIGDAPEYSPEAEELEKLITLMELYENEECPELPV